MTLGELITKTKLYVRDKNGYMFTDNEATLFLNEAIDRIKQYGMFKDMGYLVNEDDVPTPIPAHFHYILALFSASRLYDIDERFFEGTQKRNEFEQAFSDLCSMIETGEIEIDGKTSEDIPWCDDAIKDVYFSTNTSEGGTDD